MSQLITCFLTLRVKLFQTLGIYCHSFNLIKEKKLKIIFSNKNIANESFCI